MTITCAKSSLGDVSALLTRKLMIRGLSSYVKLTSRIGVFSGKFFRKPVLNFGIQSADHDLEETSVIFPGLPLYECAEPYLSLPCLEGFLCACSIRNLTAAMSKKPVRRKNSLLYSSLLFSSPLADGNGDLTPSKRFLYRIRGKKLKKEQYEVVNRGGFTTEAPVRSTSLSRTARESVGAWHPQLLIQAQRGSLRYEVTPREITLNGVRDVTSCLMCYESCSGDESMKRKDVLTERTEYPTYVLS
ncbi:hypothetical protein Tco_0077341 [Tanacetum coccineum]